MGAASTRPGPLCPAALGASPVPSPGVWGCLVTATGRGGHCAWLVLPPQEYHMLLWKPENTDPAPSPRPVRPAPLRIASRRRARARAPRARLCSAQPRCDLRSRRFSVAPRPRPGLPSVAPEMHAAAGLPRGLADRFCRAPERVSSGPTCRGRGSSPGSPVTWSQPAPAPTPWGQSRGARPAPPPRPQEPQHPPSPGASPPPKGWTHVTFLFLSGMFQAEATPTPCPSSPLSVGL